MEKKQAPRPETSAELKPDWNGCVTAAELFYMRLGTLKLRQRWVDREVSESLTIAVATGLLTLGFVVGLVVGRLSTTALPRGDARGMVMMEFPL